MKKILILITALISITIKAQEYKLFAASSENKMQLKWMSKKINIEGSFDIYKSENGAWQKLNTAPITPSPVITDAELKSPKNPFPNDKSYVFYIQNKNSKETSANKKAYAEYQLALGAIFDNQLAKHLGLYFEDNAVVKGKSYGYKLVDSKTQKEISVVNNVISGELPNAPENGKVIQEKQHCKLTWKHNEEFMGYNIYRNGSKLNAEPIMANLEKAVYQTNFIDTNVPAGSYDYVIKGITFINTESEPSADLKIEVKDLIPPKAVQGFKGERKNDTVVLSWMASIEKDITGYNILKSDDKGKTFKKINTQLVSSTENIFVEKLEAQDFGSFQYCVASVDKSNNESKTMPVSVFVPDHNAPAKPENFVGKSEVGKITLSWKSNSENDLAGYRIYRGLKDDDENEMLLLNVTPQIETTFVDVFNEKAGTKFIYKIAALDKSFNESEKVVVWMQLPDVIPPSAPFLKEANYVRNQVILKWDAVLTDAILGYDVYRIADGNELKINKEAIKELQFNDTSLLQKGVYEYYVKAIDSAKLVSKPSNKLAITTTNSENKQIQLSVSQDIRARKVQLKMEGIETDMIQDAKLFRKSGDSGFLRIPFKATNELFTDETSEEGVIYEYYVEVITTDDVKLRTDKVSFNNAF